MSMTKEDKAKKNFKKLMISVVNSKAMQERVFDKVVDAIFDYDKEHDTPESYERTLDILGSRAAVKYGKRNSEELIEELLGGLGMDIVDLVHDIMYTLYGEEE